jgi:hypothetical protein
MLVGVEHLSDAPSDDVQECTFFSFFVCPVTSLIRPKAMLSFFSSWHKLSGLIVCDDSLEIFVCYIQTNLHVPEIIANKIVDYDKYMSIPF